ncbi:MAG: hypothetical protein K0V04_06080 [Deltaproteobacteria bacterium]|nr:hypothetical protein [Deltaproteobacteria bacterium]
MHLNRLSWGALCVVCAGCNGLDEDTVVEPDARAIERSSSSTSSAYAGASQTEPLRLLHVHAVEPASDVGAARRALAEFSTADVGWVELHHRIGLSLSMSADRERATSLDAALAELEAAVSVPAADQYPHLDELLFDSAVLSLQAGDEQRGQERLLRLIREQPTSPLIPNVYATFADHLFDAGEWEDARMLYAKLQDWNMPEATAYGAYRTGMCHLVSGGDVDALGGFFRAARLAGELDGGWGRRLAEVALNEAIEAYVLGGDPSEARQLFGNIGPHVDLDTVLDRLADAYRDAGDNDGAAMIDEARANPA